MKATLEFNLPDDQRDFDFAIQGQDWWMACYELERWLYRKTKHVPDDMPKEELEAYEDAREELHRIINQLNLNLE